jgi:hypothetical protein
MQLIPRYLVKNKTVLVSNDTGFVTEYRPVYTRQLQVYKGIDNVLDFKLLNADQKAVNLTGYTPKFQAFDENKSLIIEHDGVVLDAAKGLFKVTITDNDLLNIRQQYLSYSIYLVDANGDNVITYSSAHFGGCGTIYVDACQFPGPRDTHNVTTFVEVTEDTPYWKSETIDAEPGINGNDALHTAVVYTDGYTGSITVQATLDNTVTGGTDWADIKTVTLDGTETTPTPINFNGVFSHLRFKASANPANKISKILVRN